MARTVDLASQFRNQKPLRRLAVSSPSHAPVHLVNLAWEMQATLTNCCKTQPYVFTAATYAAPPWANPYRNDRYAYRFLISVAATMADAASATAQLSTRDGSSPDPRMSGDDSLRKPVTDGNLPMTDDGDDGTQQLVIGASVVVAFVRAFSSQGAAHDKSEGRCSALTDAHRRKGTWNHISGATNNTARRGAPGAVTRADTKRAASFSSGEELASRALDR
ncbi:hypothetical protein K491DRAFT_675207 [Lophiostoma macrostomum CBS 122681]|uniref:Uncharacterized protein n=1 Tax=Lophiostoma macrostomum CBS 122681 TaxID=1314788 RepID=A0A6A6TJ68_9PLEO|nr:hypothetical protein K491DRAFT_675207 [Lophiostoma macrostomum CBS 122681]